MIASIRQLLWGNMGEGAKRRKKEGGGGGGGGGETEQ
jgi:hypothetical protein